MIKKWKSIPILFRIASIALLMAVAMMNPFIRAIVIYILPLGSGIDDFIVLALIGIGAAGAYFGTWIALFDKFRGKRKKGVGK